MLRAPLSRWSWSDIVRRDGPVTTAAGVGVGMECPKYWSGDHGTVPRSPDGWRNFPAPTRNRPNHGIGLLTVLL